MVQTAAINPETTGNPRGKGTAGSFPSFSKQFKKRRKWLKVLAFLAPALLIYSLFMALPLLLSLKVSLYHGAGAVSGDYVGLANFKSLFTNQTYSVRFFNALTNNFKLFFMTMLFQNVLALLIALVLNKELPFFGAIRTILFMPVTMSVLLIGFVWTLILNPNWGSLNYLLTAAGLGSLAKPWLGDPHLALVSVAAVNAWQYIGLPIMMFLAGLQAIPKEYFEAAQIDGAGPLRQFRHIALPHLLPVIGMVTILTLVGDFSSFELVYALEGTLAGPNYATDVLGTLFYRTAFSSYGGTIPDLGLGAVIATITFFIVLAIVLIWLYFTLWRKQE